MGGSGNYRPGAAVPNGTFANSSDASDRPRDGTGSTTVTRIIKDGSENDER
jgi:hypothetical protein